MILKELVRHAIFRERASSEAYCRFLRKRGVRIGEGTFFFAPKTTTVDMTRPYMLSIGRNVMVAAGVTILSHDYGWSVVKGVQGDVYGSCDETLIDDNVFLGVNSVILKGAHVGANVIIGAGSVVSGDIPDNCVAAGVPCRPLQTLEEYARRRREFQVEEAYQQYRCYWNHRGAKPSRTEFREFFWLFADEDEVRETPTFRDVMVLVDGSEERSWRRFATTRDVRPFRCFDEFAAYCDDRLSREQAHACVMREDD